MRELPRVLALSARENRKSATLPERLLWNVLRERALDGLKFRRQHPIGPYILDFYCPSHKLAIELDGKSPLTRGSTLRRGEGPVSRQPLHPAYFAFRMLLCCVVLLR